MLVLLISHAGIDRRLLHLDVAGQPCRQHLVSNLASSGELEVREDETVDGAGTQLPDGGVLLVDRDVWFSTTALSHLVKAVSGSAGAVRIVADGDVLAMYLPGAAARAYRQRDPAAWSGGVGRISRDFEDSRQIGCPALAGADDDASAMRVRNLKDVAVLERRILYGRACRAMEQGTRIRDPHHIAIRGDLRCGAGVEIDINVIVEGAVRLGDGVSIGANSILIDAVVGAHSVVKPFSIVEGTTIGAGAIVGPYGRVRPGSVLGERVQIGNFVEIKNAEVGAGARINHLAFIGDATLGEGATIGAGTITCNHTGAGTARTVIGANAYVGSGTELVAPVTVGDRATIGAGSTITADAPSGMLTIARARQVTIPNWLPRDGKSDRK
jgi:acetyltransferase-like isoleucine patch superfamily enzyme